MNRIREARKAKSLTMKELGQLIGVSESAISMYETFKREPDNATLVNIAKTLDVSVDYLLGRTETNETKNQPPAQGEELDRQLVSMLLDLDPMDAQRVRDFVEGLKAARAEPASPSA